jgi:hypothetical protein
MTENLSICVASNYDVSVKVNWQQTNEQRANGQRACSLFLCLFYLSIVFLDQKKDQGMLKSTLHQHSTPTSILKSRPKSLKTLAPHLEKCSEKTHVYSILTSSIILPPGPHPVTPLWKSVRHAPVGFPPRSLLVRKTTRHQLRIW